MRTSFLEIVDFWAWCATLVRFVILQECVHFCAKCFLPVFIAVFGNISVHFSQSLNKLTSVFGMWKVEEFAWDGAGLFHDALVHRAGQDGLAQTRKFVHNLGDQFRVKGWVG